MTYDDGGIFNLEIKDHEITLDISWCNYSPKARTNDFSNIIIDADSLYWENIPNLKN